MNKVILMGRLTRDPEVRYSQESRQPQSQDIPSQLTVDFAGTMTSRLLILSHALHSDVLVSLQRNISAKEQR